MISGESDHLAGRPIDPDPRPDLEGVPFDPRLKLLEAVVREPNWTIREEHRRQCDVERERRVVTTAKSAAARGEIGVDVRRPEGPLGVAEQIRDRCSDLCGRLHANNEIEVLASGVIPGKPTLRLESHRVDRLRFELAVQHQKCRIVRCKFRPDLFAIGRGFGIGLPGRNRQPIPFRATRTLEKTRTDPAVLGWRVDIGRVRGRASHARETKGAVIGHRDGAGFFTELQNSFVAKGEPRLIERVEILENQQRHGLTQIERRFADRAEEVAGIEFGNACADTREVGGGNHDRGLQRTAQARKVDSGQDVRRVRSPDEHGVRSGRRPIGEIGCAKVRRVELGSRYLGDAVNATHPVGGRVPALPSRQRLARRESGSLGACQARQTERNPTRRDQLDELASRSPHAHLFVSTLLASVISIDPPPCRCRLASKYRPFLASRRRRPHPQHLRQL